MRVLLLSLLCLFLATASARAQCRVEGTIRLSDGTPLAGATVQIDGADYKKPVTATAGSDGRYVFAEVKAGTRVRIVAFKGTEAIATGYTLVTQWVEVVDLQQGVLSASPGSADYVLASSGPSGEIAGFVRASDGAVPDARVTINETSVTARTDGAGRYLFSGLRPGIDVELHVAATGFEAVTRKVHVPESGRIDASFLLDSAAGAPQAETSRSGPELTRLDDSADGGRIAGRPADVAAIPSVVRNDLFRAVQFLPGIDGTLDTSTPFYVRGGGSDQTRVTADGVTLYQVADPFNGLTPYNLDTVQKGELSFAPVDDGGGLAGAVRLAGASASSGKPSGFVDVSALGFAGLIRTPIGNRLSAMVAGRSSPSTSLYNDVLDRFSIRGGESARDRQARFSGGAFSGVPTSSSYHDVNARFDFEATSRDRVSASIYDGDNDANNSCDVALPPPAVGQIDVPVERELPDDAVVQASRVQRWTSRGWSGVWTHAWPAGVSSTVSFSRSEYSKTGDQAFVLTSPTTGLDYSYLGARNGSSAISETNDLDDSTLRAEVKFGIGFAHALSAGTEISSYDVSYNAETEAVRDVSGTFSSSLVDLLRRSTTGSVAAFYVRDSWRPVARLTLSPGIRIVRDGLSSATLVEPRVSASYQVLPLFRVRGAWSIDHQTLSRITREDQLHGDTGFWALADGTDIPVSRAQQAVAGFTVERQNVLFDVSGFYRSLDGLTMFAPRLYSGVAPGAENRLFQGSGTAKGITALVQHQVDRNTIWASFTVSEVLNTFPALEAESFPASTDQRSELKIADAVEIMSRWSVSAAWVVGSGHPYTAASKVDSVWFPDGTAVTQVVFGSKNSSRLPAYHRLDLATERDFVFGRSTVSVGGAVFNVYNQRNLFAIEYDSADGVLTSNDLIEMGRAVNAFVRVGF
jgi:hypothetical protein